MQTREFNFDGLVGPTHNYAGLSYGNVASMNHKAAVSNPREAALQGLEKMRALAEMGIAQGVLAPQERPDVHVLRRLGFAGTDAEVLRGVLKTAPEILAAVSSASSMWTANAATVSPSFDSLDGRVHFTPANLTAKFHRSIEFETTARILRAMFKGEVFAHHSALPMSAALGDEGAANHTRFAPTYGEPGVQLFVYGRVAFNEQSPRPQKFPARQTLEASEAIARRHGLSPERVVFAAQNPRAIDLGAFHNDVVAVGNLDLFFYHAEALLDSASTLKELSAKYLRLGRGELRPLEVSAADVPLEAAVKSYLFNSQLVRGSAGQTILISPRECAENERVKAYLDRIVGPDKLIHAVHYFDLRQSMRNGGGPACLRLRVVLTEAEVQATNPRVLFSNALYLELKNWIERHYRDRLELADLGDAQFLTEVCGALDELTQILGLGSVYPFQI